jgi:predicted enzyme related to lactoylglutathione lyase
MPEHKILHIEISAKDRVAAGKFYSDLFGWEVNQNEEMDYASFVDADGLSAGLNPVTDTAPAGSVVPYITCKDVAGTLTKAETLGAKAVMDATDIPTVGVIGVFIDPTGNMIGVMTPAEM